MSPSGNDGVRRQPDDHIVYDGALRLGQGRGRETPG
jgi:hypothetical protein